KQPDAGRTLPDPAPVAGAGSSAGALSPVASGGRGELGPLFVETTYGQVAAIVASDKRVFRSIRYAAPPIGELRFAPPRAPEPWKQALLSEPRACPQLGADGQLIGSEDCLQLEVWTPRERPAAPLPVLVWIHGGGFTAGSGALIDTQLPARGAVVVAINYRLGALGFLAHPALGADSGNAAILDQRFALQWVRENIAAFDGDPERVAIFGESAGGSAVCAQLWSPASAGLFHGAIIQSGALCGRQSRSLAEGEAQGERLAMAVGCAGERDVLACLRARPPAELLAALPLRTVLAEGASWGPVVDGRVFAQDLPAALAAGAFAQVPLIIGSNAHEGDGFVFGLEALSAVGYAEQVRQSPFFGGHADALLAAYPVADFPTPQLALAELVGDRVFGCPARRTVRAFAAAGLASYLYHYDFPPAWHASELGVLFAPGASEPEQRVSALINDAWARFAANGDPNGEGSSAWPRYAPSSDEHIALDDPPSRGAQLHAARCDLWDQLEP
ncbi:MAG TPA: carboxylesterase family protein, partial [Conexibacter sp.]|nr:carboxylesterase family protein [Conexibacter sp.]